ncbi:hypothetical protein [Pseudomonas asplenii]|uniref:hypothetical protein n=1 Tax=Pseudomonas asplenii TaxID=53407 RepID=UPI0006CD378B|nr:hypothetical protein [Pseudomonas fuscovaginae]KPA98046.1 hypothetical protein PF70_01840 [Pseudomonas fuscovaginae]
MADDVASDAPRIYQLDLFSLISFGLAIAAFAVSIFMGWLSWEFYKKSKESSDQTQQAVTKIEAAVLSIQSEITEIVRRAVGYWTGGDSNQEAVDLSAILNNRIDELSSQIKELAGANGEKEGLDSKIAELIQLQKDQVANLTSSMVDAKAKAIFPSIDRGPAAQITQSIQTNTEAEKSGELIINVLRAVKNVTATGKFTPPFTDLPDLKVDIIGAPTSDLSKLLLSSGVGKTSDFNVHLIGKSGLLEVGTYVVKYIAKHAG